MSVRQEKKRLKEQYEKLLQKEYELIKQRHVLTEQLDLLKRNISTFWHKNFYQLRYILISAKTKNLDDYNFHGLSEAETEILLDYLEDMFAATQDNEEKVFVKYNIDFTKSQISAGCPGSKARVCYPLEL